MSRNRMSLLLAVVAMAIVAVGGFFLAIQPQLAASAAARAQTRTVQTSNDANRAELSRLSAQAAKLPAMRRELTARTASVPAGADLPAFIDELDGVAASSGMQVSSFTSSDAVAYAPATPALAAGAAAGGASATPSPGPSTGTSASAAPAVPVAPVAPTAVTNPSITGENLSVIPVTVAVDGSFDQALAFVRGMQSGARLFLITTISSTATSGDGGSASNNSTWTFGGSIYVLDTSTSTATGTGATGTDATGTGATGTGTNTPGTTTPGTAATGTATPAAKR
ncbi:hypothetical protein [Curtobacterium sp. ISL-83]|uniref:hypothetical protein n=1 Tax=Curtobacterium sp. ISL-83 TaxID=2819145 RepID=UPI001BEB38E2|nr:hypothetical protein [Curtobacterium sp. ISL-83]MBT2501973.1 hypothetical protein [Curtobacterium sp. ISL-83]